MPAAPVLGVKCRATLKPSVRVAAPVVDPLGSPTHSLPGIGPAFAERLAEKNLETVEDLLWCLQRRYDDVRDAKQLASRPVGLADHAVVVDDEQGIGGV